MCHPGFDECNGIHNTSFLSIILFHLGDLAGLRRLSAAVLPGHRPHAPPGDVSHSAPLFGASAGIPSLTSPSLHRRYRLVSRRASASNRSHADTTSSAKSTSPTDRPSPRCDGTSALRRRRGRKISWKAVCPNPKRALKYAFACLTVQLARCHSKPKTHSSMLGSDGLAATVFSLIDAAPACAAVPPGSRSA